jgi:capsular exopolysaccharide synthesis family protein
MTRLSKALERARSGGGDGTAGVIRADEHAREQSVPRAWHFDDGEGAAITPPQVLKLAKPQADPDIFENRFADDFGGKVVVGTGAERNLVEEYRRIGAVLHHAQTERHMRSVMVASAVASEGKTLTSTNLALTLSHSYQRRVLLIDADLRRPYLHTAFRLQNQIGLGDGLRQPEVGQLPVQRISPTLCVLTAGHPDPDPMSGLVSSSMRQLIAEAVREFDWVVIDTPPVALMPDANLLARMIDCALLVVRAGSTPYPLVKRAVDAIGPERIMGVVLNCAQTDLAGADGYYQYYQQIGPRADATRSRFRLFRKDSAEQPPEC